MATKQQKIQQTTVTCETCKKVITAPNGYPAPVDYVNYCGHNLCWDCIKSGKSNQFRQI